MARMLMLVEVFCFYWFNKGAGQAEVWWLVVMEGSWKTWTTEHDDVEAGYLDVWHELEALYCAFFIDGTW